MRLPSPPRDNYVPSGHYSAVIFDTCEQIAPNGHNFYAITFMLIEGEYAGRTIVDELHCKDPNPDISDAEYGRLSAICRAVDIRKINAHAAELHGIPLEIDVITIGRTSLIQWYQKRAPHVTVTETVFTRTTRVDH